MLLLWNHPSESDNGNGRCQGCIRIYDYRRGYVNQATVQFITGDLDVEKDWDSYISRMESMGVNDYIRIYQKYYDIYRANQN